MTTSELAILIALLQVADAASTLYFLRYTEIQEANPLLRRLFARFGAAPTLLVLKGAYAASIWVWRESLSPWSLWLVVALYVAVVAWNLHLIRRAT
jgi:hypothetical protein